jgi:Putative zinc-finger
MIVRWLKITCRQAHVLLSERLDRALRPMEVVRLRLHLSVCDMCSLVARQFRVLSDAVRRIGN